MALDNGMDVKNLSTIIGHNSSGATLDFYFHVTDTMQKQAVVKIDHQIGKTDAPASGGRKENPHRSERLPALPAEAQQVRHRLRFPDQRPPLGGKTLPWGADGKRISRNVYAKTKEKCEEKLAVMIEKMKKGIAAEKGKLGI